MRFRFDDFSFDAEALELRRGDVSIALQPKVLRFVGYLLENRDRTVTPEELLDSLWPGVSVGRRPWKGGNRLRNTIETRIKKVNNK